MNRRAFALSWGRKIFFGITWPLSAILFLIYLQSYLIPDGVSSWVYFVTTSIALSGLFTTLAFFLIYFPLVSAIPGYYTTRIVSGLCAVLIQGGILLDGTVFSRFRFHLKPEHLEILPELSEAGIVPLSSFFLVAIIVTGTLIFSLFQGGRLWKNMQKRFTNPVSSWYFFLIAGCFLVSHLLFLREDFQSFGHQQTIASVFPLNYQTLLEKTPGAGQQTTFKYPTEKMVCPGKASPNIYFIVVPGLSEEVFTEAEMPFSYHLPDHGTLFSSHVLPARSSEDAIFSLFYGIPAIHRGVARESRPVLVEELLKRDYALYLRGEGPELRALGGKTADGDVFADFPGDLQSPHFAFFELPKTSVKEADDSIRRFLATLHQRGLLSESLVLLTGSHSQGETKMPLIIAWPNRRKGEWSHRTSHYDVTPTLMQELWGCKTKFSAFSGGSSLFLAPEEEWEIYGTRSEIELYEPASGRRITGNWAGEILGSASKEDKLRYLKALRHSLRFYRR